VTADSALAKIQLPRLNLGENEFYICVRENDIGLCYILLHVLIIINAHRKEFCNNMIQICHGFIKVQTSGLWSLPMGDCFQCGLTYCSLLFY